MPGRKRCGFFGLDVGARELGGRLPSRGERGGPGEHEREVEDKGGGSASTHCLTLVRVGWFAVPCLLLIFSLAASSTALLLRFLSHYQTGLDDLAP